MKVLLVHNFYQQAGGEDRVFQQEGDLLEEHGNEVTRFSIHNNQIANLNKLRLVGAHCGTDPLQPKYELSSSEYNRMLYTATIFSLLYLPQSIMLRSR